MSDSQPARPGSKGSGGTNPDADPDDTGDGQTAVVTQPQRPSGKRSRRGAADEGDSEAVDLETGTTATPTKNGSGAAKTARKGGDGPSRNPFTYIWNYLQQVIAELRKVIWPNRKQMVSYTSVVLVFLAFMVALIWGTDLGLGKLVSMVFG